jgi:molybdopterin-guanine dinucleotide biosynthesis protein A
MDKQAITGIILCGGRGRRMGGVDKPLELLNGRSLVSHVRERLTQQVGRIIISANRSLDAYASFGDVIVTDIEAGQGPLGGLVSALALAESEWFFCCPGDAPRLDWSLVARLARHIGSADAAVAHDGTQSQYLFLLGRRSLCAAMEAYLATGERTVQGFLASIAPVEVDASDIAASFANINTQAELAQLSEE